MSYVQRIFSNGHLSWSMCTHWPHWQHSFSKLQPSVFHLPRCSINTSSWKLYARWQGNRNITPTLSENSSQDKFSFLRLLKPFIFTLTVSGVSIAGAAIWQYEYVRSQTVKGSWRNRNHLPKYGQFRQHIHNMWKKLSDGDKIFVPICALNILVFLAWKVPKWTPVMSKYFISGLGSNDLRWPMLLSVFSHYSLLHILANMFVLHSFSQKAVSALGREQFLAMYLSGGIWSSFTSLCYKAAMKTPTGSLGASGAVLCVLGYFCLKYPESKLVVVFLPQYPFEASSGLKCLLCFDTLGCILRWSLFDHAAHLGGASFGIAWFYWGHDYLWKKREPIVTAWHKLRGPVR